MNKSCLVLLKHNGKSHIKTELHTGLGFSNVALVCEDPDAYYPLIKEVLLQHPEVSFTQELDGLDQQTWDFLFRNSAFCFINNHYVGLSIYPANLEHASAVENTLAEALAEYVCRNL